MSFKQKNTKTHCPKRTSAMVSKTSKFLNCIFVSILILGIDHIARYFVDHHEKVIYVNAKIPEPEISFAGQNSSYTILNYYIKYIEVIKSFYLRENKNYKRPITCVK